MQDGIYSNITELLGFRFHVKRRKLTHQQTLIATKAGYHQAIRKGRGMTFSEVREYQAGDEVRHIDWKVSARAQKTHTKVFTEELEKPILCLTEQTPKMFFGSQVRFKSVQAMNITAIIGWVALNNGDKFGGQIFNNQRSSWNKPKQDHKALLHVFHNGLGLQKTIKSPVSNINNQQLWAEQLESAGKQVNSGSRLFLIGDFLKQSTDFFQQLAYFKKRNQLTLIHVFDPLEKKLPNSGMLSFSNGISKILMNTNLASQQKQYQQSYANNWQELKDNCGKLHIPVIEIDCTKNPVAELLNQKVIH